jgi:hypothetical protein
LGGLELEDIGVHATKHIVRLSLNGWRDSLSDRRNGLGGSSTEVGRSKDLVDFLHLPRFAFGHGSVVLGNRNAVSTHRVRAIAVRRRPRGRCTRRAALGGVRTFVAPARAREPSVPTKSTVLVEKEALILVEDLVTLRERVDASRRHTHHRLAGRTERIVGGVIVVSGIAVGVGSSVVGGGGAVVGVDGAHDGDGRW